MRAFALVFLRLITRSLVTYVVVVVRLAGMVGKIIRQVRTIVMQQRLIQLLFCVCMHSVCGRSGRCNAR